MNGPAPDWEALTAQADELLHHLFPTCRSITGDGLRKTLQHLRRCTPFDLQEVPSGSPCYDWIIPDEWNARDAFVADSQGRRVIDFQANNLHLVNYSIPFEGDLSFDELAAHLHTLPKLTKAIPYRTTYYNRTWGFCLTQEQLNALDRDETYHVVVETTLTPGALTFGEALLPGSSGQEFLVSTYACHPSLANDNLSGIVLWTFLLRDLRRQTLRHSYRFVIAPETIGALAYISRNEAAVKALTGGFVVTSVAGPGPFGYKPTWRGDSLVDRAVRLTWKELNLEPNEYPFKIHGSDERQYSTPGLRIPVATICKDKYSEYDYYHTSLDNLEFISASNLVETLKLYWLTIEKLEQNRIYRSLNPIGEPMLGKRGLYPQIGGSFLQKAADAASQPEHRDRVADEKVLDEKELSAILWVLFYADGQTSLLDVAEKTGLPLSQLNMVAEKLVEHKLLEVVGA
jgi:aminopeptidase-like protein